MFQRWRASVSSFLSWEEISSNRSLQVIWWILLAYQVLLFSVFLGDDAGTTNAFVANQYTCWPWLPQCGEWYFLSLKPALSQTVWYVTLFALQGAAFAAAFKQRWYLALSLLAVLLTWESILVLVLSYEAGEAYIYMHLVLGAVLLALPAKRYTLQLCIILVSVLGALMEWYRYWYLAGGASFKLSLLTAGQSVWMISLVFVVQAVGIFYLLSRNNRYRRGVLLVLLALHAYGALSFDEHYFVLMLPVLLALFWDHESPPYLSKLNVVILATGAVLILIVHLWIFAASASLNFTFARPHLGISTYFPQTSGVSQARIMYTDGTTEDVRSTWTDRPCRCSPYSRWFELKNRCRYDERIASISWTLDLSLQRGKWSRVIDVPNVCSLDFSVLQPNNWIQQNNISTQVR